MGMYKDLEGKRVVVTGGASGIGLATAQRFVNEGSKV
ncbi:MAG: SDR family NAD(P)-dependent oxidoreductase, partial [Candidatus Heimdallarchaeota archaeon]